MASNSRKAEEKATHLLKFAVLKQITDFEDFHGRPNVLHILGSGATLKLRSTMMAMREATQNFPLLLNFLQFLEKQSEKTANGTSEPKAKRQSLCIWPRLPAETNKKRFQLNFNITKGTCGIGIYFVSNLTHVGSDRLEASSSESAPEGVNDWDLDLYLNLSDKATDDCLKQLLSMTQSDLTRLLEMGQIAILAPVKAEILTYAELQEFFAMEEEKDLTKRAQYLDSLSTSANTMDYEDSEDGRSSSSNSSVIAARSYTTDGCAPTVKRKSYQASETDVLDCSGLKESLTQTKITLKRKATTTEPVRIKTLKHKNTVLNNFFGTNGFEDICPSENLRLHYVFFRLRSMHECHTALDLINRTFRFTANLSNRINWRFQYNSFSEQDLNALVDHYNNIRLSDASHDSGIGSFISNMGSVIVAEHTNIVETLTEDDDDFDSPLTSSQQKRTRLAATRQRGFSADVASSSRQGNEAAADSGIAVSEISEGHSEEAFSESYRASERSWDNERGSVVIRKPANLVTPEMVTRSQPLNLLCQMKLLRESNDPKMYRKFFVLRSMKEFMALLPEKIIRPGHTIYAIKSEAFATILQGRANVDFSDSLTQDRLIKIIHGLNYVIADLKGQKYKDKRLPSPSHAWLHAGIYAGGCDQDNKYVVEFVRDESHIHTGYVQLVELEEFFGAFASQNTLFFSVHQSCNNGTQVTQQNALATINITEKHDDLLVNSSTFVAALSGFLEAIPNPPRYAFDNYYTDEDYWADHDCQFEVKLVTFKNRLVNICISNQINIDKHAFVIRNGKVVLKYQARHKERY